MSHTGNHGPGQYWWKLTFLSKFVINKIIVYRGGINEGNSLEKVEVLIDGQSFGELSPVSIDGPVTIDTNGKLGTSDLYSYAYLYYVYFYSYWLS